MITTTTTSNSLGSSIIARLQQQGPSSLSQQLGQPAATPRSLLHPHSSYQLGSTGWEQEGEAAFMMAVRPGGSGPGIMPKMPCDFCEVWF